MSSLSFSHCVYPFLAAKGRIDATVIQFPLPCGFSKGNSRQRSGYMLMNINRLGKIQHAYC
jgi:hypothetical protein